MKIKNSIFYLLNFIVLVTIIYLLSQKTIFSKTLVWSTWSFSELLIYYPENIFVRRGLLGEIFLFFANENAVLPVIQNFVFYNFLLLILLSSITLYIYRVGIYQYFLFLLSAFGFFNLVLHDLSYHRKEILALNFFLTFLILKKFDNSLKIQLINIVYLFTSTLILSLIHEGMVLMFFPFYYVLLKNIETDFGFKNIRNFYFIFTISTILILVLNSGSSEISTIMFNNLHPEDKVIFKDYSVDAIRAIGWSLKRALILPIRIWLSGNAFYWLYVLFLIAFTNYIILFNNNFEKFKNLIVNFHKDNPVLLITYSIFFIGWDWGRWFIVLNYLYLFTFTVLNYKSNHKYDTNYSIFPVLIFIVMSLLTIVPECCLAWTDPRIFNILENYIGEIKINY